MIFNIIFAGTPEFASVALQYLIDNGHTISLVLTKPDSISGRGRELKYPAVKILALKYDIPVLQPTSLKSNEIEQALKDVNADFMIVAAYGMILPQAILDIPKYGCLNIHGSLLPAWRGAAPIQRAILAGNNETGITIIQMNAGLDTGDILSMYSLPILETDTTDSLYEKLAIVGGKAIVETIKNYLMITPVSQLAENVSYAVKLTKEEAKINWNQSCSKILIGIRGYNPFPGAFTLLNDKTVKVWEAQHFNNEHHLIPGSIVVSNKKLLVAGNDGFISIEKIQLPGQKKISAQDFINGNKNLLIMFN
jgi:methionyl-tRNA formyltransferase